MAGIGLSEAYQWEVLKIVAGILHLGNIDFVEVRQIGYFVDVNRNFICLKLYWSECTN